MLPPNDHDLISEAPVPLYMGGMPQSWEDAPARVIVNLCGMFPRGAPEGRIVFSLPLLDMMDPAVLPPRRVLETFLDGVHMLARSQPTYWHCHAGLNRSGLVVATYLHRYRRMRISTAIDRLRQRRSPMALCNPVFERTLREWYGDPDEQAFEPVLPEPIAAEWNRAVLATASTFEDSEDDELG